MVDKLVIMVVVEWILVYKVVLFGLFAKLKVPPSLKHFCISEANNPEKDDNTETNNR